MELAKIRRKIDAIDAEIVALLNRRAREAVKVSLVKKENRLAVYVPEREAIILSRVKKIGKGLIAKEDLDIIFRDILSACRSIETNLKIAYLGPQGTYTHQAAIKNFGRKPKYFACNSISDVFDKVERDEADYGVVPIENSTEGAVNYTLDMFFSSNLKICAEITLNISHSLLTKYPKSKIKHIYSNPQVFAQCRKWLGQNYPGAELVPVSSTAKAALAAIKDKKGACIGNKILAQIYNLKTVASFIEDSYSNITRFLIVGKNDSYLSGNDKTSILFSVKDRVGALHDVLFAFKKYGINLTKIESRPSKKKAWEYYFFVDIDGHKDSGKFKKALVDLKKSCVFVKILGSYPKEN